MTIEDPPARPTPTRDKSDPAVRADLDAALRRMCDLVAIRERMRIAEFMYVAAAYGDLALGWMLAASGTCSLEEARATLAIGDRRAGSDGRATGEIPN